MELIPHLTEQIDGFLFSSRLGSGEKTIRRTEFPTLNFQINSSPTPYYCHLDLSHQEFKASIVPFLFIKKIQIDIVKWVASLGGEEKRRLRAADVAPQAGGVVKIKAQSSHIKTRKARTQDLHPHQILRKAKIFLPQTETQQSPRHLRQNQGRRRMFEHLHVPKMRRTGQPNDFRLIRLSLTLGLQRRISTENWERIATNSM